MGVEAGQEGPQISTAAAGRNSSSLSIVPSDGYLHGGIVGYKAFAKDAVVIASSTLISAIAAFLLLPLVTKTLGAAEYGLYSQFLVTVTLLTPLVLLGLTFAILRLLSSTTEKTELREGYYSILFFVTLVGLLVLLIMILAAQQVATGLFNDPTLSGLVMLLPLIVLTSALIQVNLYFFRAVQRIKAFAFFFVAKSAGELLVIMAFLLAGMGLEGVLLGILVADLVVLTTSLTYITSILGFTFPRFTILRASLKFGLPVTPPSILSWLINLSYPYFIGLFLGLAYVGSYSAAFSIGGVIYLLASPIQLALLPILSRLYDATNLDGVRSHLSQSLRHYLLLAIPSVAGLTVLAPVMLQTLTTPEFIAGAVVLPFIALAGMLNGVSMIVCNVLFLVKKTHLELVVHVVSAVVVVTFNLLLIPLTGILGAAFATLLASIAMTLLTYHYSFSHIRFSLDWPIISRSVAAAVIMVGVILLFYPSNFIGLLVMISVGGAVYFLVLVSIGGLNVDEKNFLKDLTSRAIRRIISSKE